MDLESTGLPKEELNKTKIIEISLIAVKREHLLNCKPSTMPRVQQKVTLCFNPCRLIDPGATAATGLCNFLLEHEPNFKNGVSILETFFNMLTKPVCLVAYNGLNFDFPLLRNHLEKEKVNIDAELVCADALHCFYDIMKEEEVPPTAIGKAEPTNSMQILNETTPRKQIISAAQRYQHLTYGKARRRLFWGEGPKPAQRFRLADVYERLLKEKAVGCHNAEADSILMMKCAVVLGEQFADWVDANVCIFNEVKPMTLGVPI